MPVKVIVNDLTLAHKGSNGTGTATLPDMCKTPSPGGPVPLPYPNIVMSADLAKGTTTIKVDGGNMAANKGSELSRSTGDEAGTAGGVTSSTFIKEATWMLYSEDVFLEGKNACRLTDKLFMNHQNTTCMQGWIQEYREAEEVGLEEACEMLGKYIDYVIGSTRDEDGNDTVTEHPNPDGGMEGQGIDTATPRGPLGESPPPAGPTTRAGQRMMPRAKSLQHRMCQNRGFDLVEGEGAPPGDPSGSWERHDQHIEDRQNHLGELLDNYEENCTPPPTSKKRETRERREFRERVERGRRYQNMNRPQPEHWGVPTNQVPLGW